MGRIRKRRRRIIRLTGAALLAAAALVVVFLFQVKVVVVTGNTRHTGQEIADGFSYDFLTQNTLYLMWKYRSGAVPERLPYLSSMRIRLDSPSKISVTVTEKEPVGYVYKDQNLYFDEDGIILEMTNEVYDGIPVVTGVPMGDPVLYQKMPTDSAAQLRTILSLTQLLRYQGLEAREIRFSDSMDITVMIGKVDALLGQDEYLEEKVANLRAILDAMDGSAGTLHMENFTGKNEPVSFSKDGEQETESETDGGQDGTDADEPGDDGQDRADEPGDGSQDGADEPGDGSQNGADEPGDGGQDGADGMAGSGDGSQNGSDGMDEPGDDGQNGADGMDEPGDGGQDGAADDGSGADGEEPDEQEPSAGFMVFNSSGTLVYNAHVVDGVVVDGNGVPIDGCTVNEDGHVVDAYWNEIDPVTGQTLNLPAQ